MTNKISNEEINKYIGENYGNLNVNSLTPSEQLNLAGEIANATGKYVHVNGINMHPDKQKSEREISEDSFSKIAMIILFLVIGVILLFFCVSFSAYFYSIYLHS